VLCIYETLIQLKYDKLVLNCVSIVIYTVSPKTRHQLNINRFSNFFFTDGLASKFATNSCLNISLRLKHVTTLPCEISMSEKWRQSNMYCNDKSQRDTAHHLRNDELL